MSFFKKGTPVKIDEVAKTEEDFESLRKRVADQNNLIRCSECSHLLAKKSDDGVVDIQHKKVVALVKEAKQVEIQCPICRSITRA